MYKVFLKTDRDGRVIAINNDAFMPSTDGWTLIDEGEGDRFHHAQNNYLPLPLMTDEGVYRYKLADGKVVERTPEELTPDIAAAQAPGIARAGILAYLSQARADNRAFLDIASPTASNRNSQVTKLTRQNMRIMRLLLNDLSGEE